MVIWFGAGSHGDRQGKKVVAFGLFVKCLFSPSTMYLKLLGYDFSNKSLFFSKNFCFPSILSPEKK